jgi:hypothetical protein
VNVKLISTEEVEKDGQAIGKRDSGLWGKIRLGKDRELVGEITSGLIDGA